MRSRSGLDRNARTRAGRARGAAHGGGGAAAVGTGAAGTGSAGTVADGWRRRLRARAAIAARAPALLVMLAVLVALFFRLGAVPLFDVDEGAATTSRPGSTASRASTSRS